MLLNGISDDEDSPPELSLLRSKREPASRVQKTISGN